MKLFSTLPAATNDEYRKVIKQQMNRMILLGLIGLFTLAVVFLGKYAFQLIVDDHTLSYYSGIGCGLIFAAAALWFKNKRLLSNEERLKESRLKYTDERIRAIQQKAWQWASIILLVVIYFFFLFGALLYPNYMSDLYPVFGICIFSFFASYFIFFRIYEKRM